MLLVGCSDSGSDDSGTDIRLPEGTKTDYSIYADETSGTPADGISFTTTGPWRATVTQTRAEGDASWVTVTPDHGDAAGDYTVTITLDVNTTGEDRAATVTIVCGATSITITVEQKGTTADGDVPSDVDEPLEPAYDQLVSEVLYTVGEEERSSIELSYDDQDRLILWRKISAEYVSEGQTETTVKTVEYAYGDGVVHIVCDDKTVYTVYLNAEGYAERVERNRDGEVLVTVYTYDEYNQLIHAEQDDEWEDYVWRDGNLVESRYGTIDGDSEILHFTYTDIENKETPDFICAWKEQTSWYEELAWANLLGIRNRSLLESRRGEGEWAYKDDFDVEYEANSQGYVLSATEYRLTADGERINPRTYDVSHVDSAGAK